MGESKRRKKLDPSFGQSDLKVEFLDESSQEYQDLLEDERVQKICQPMDSFYLLKVQNPSRGFVVYCIGQPVLMDGKTMNPYLFTLVGQGDPARPWFERHQRQVQRVVSQRAANDLKQAQVVITAPSS